MNVEGWKGGTERIGLVDSSLLVARCSLLFRRNLELMESGTELIGRTTEENEGNQGSELVAVWRRSRERRKTGVVGTTDTHSWALMSDSDDGVPDP